MRPWFVLVLTGCAVVATQPPVAHVPAFTADLMYVSRAGESLR